MLDEGYFTKLDERLEDIQLSIAEIRLVYQSQAKRLERCENELFGNGRAGLATQVRAILWIAGGCLAFLGLVVVQLVRVWIAGT